MVENNYLLIGSGCRETALGYALQKSNDLNSLHCISQFLQPQMKQLCTHYETVSNETSSSSTFITTCLEYCTTHRINKVIIGSESYLMTELVETLEQHNIFCIAPNHFFAKLETSKLFCRQLLGTNSLEIYNPDYITITRHCSLSYILDFLDKYNNKVVVKPDNPMGGKGVKVYGEHLHSKNEILSYIFNLLESPLHAHSPNTEQIVLLEEKLEGQEFSFISITDGESLQHSFPIVDFKRLKNQNKGPNTGSMGCITEENSSLFTKNDIEIASSINEKVVAILNNQYPHTQKTETNFKYNFYKGFLYGSFIKLANGKLKVIEYNARLGDPEAIPFLMQLNTPLLDICNAIHTQTLHKFETLFRPVNSLTQYLVPREYPKVKQNTPFVMYNLTNIEQEHLFFGSLRENTNHQKEEKQYEALRSRTLCAYFDSEQLTTLQIKANQLLEKCNKQNNNKFYYRTDLVNCYTSTQDVCEDAYKEVGVDIDLGNSIVKQIAPHVKETYTPFVVNEIGSFGGCFSIPNYYKDPILVSSIDGVGTKSILVEDIMGTKGYYNLGQDIVNHCVNDILVQGAKPLFFMDYIASSSLTADCVVEFVKGIAYACKQVGCAILGGETAEMPNVYQAGRYDLVGNIVGVVERDNLIQPTETIRENDCIIALPSSGPHTNGYSLIRKIIKEQVSENLSQITPEFLKDLCAPHKSYLQEIETLENENIPIHGLCHVTGGGFHDNIVRILPNTLHAEFENFQYSPLFQKIQKLGNVDDTTMKKVFNCGWGMLIITDIVYTSRIQKICPYAKQIGKITRKV